MLMLPHVLPVLRVLVAVTGEPQVRDDWRDQRPGVNLANRRSTLDYDLVSHRIFSRNRGLFSGEDVMILYIHILIHLIA